MIRSMRGSADLALYTSSDFARLEQGPAAGQTHVVRVGWLFVLLHHYICLCPDVSSDVKYERPLALSFFYSSQAI